MQSYVDSYEACGNITANTDQRNKKHLIVWGQTLEKIHYAKYSPKCQMPREFVRILIGEYECINCQASAF